MPRPPRLDSAGTVTHVIARGNERRPLFREDADRERYLELLAEACGRHRARVLAYCLMPNHIHLIAVPERDDSLVRALGCTRLVSTGS